MPENIDGMLKEYRRMIADVAGGHLAEVILYGSYARGDYRQDSDVDIMILLDMEEGSPLFGQLEDKIIDATYDFNWDHGCEIMPVVKSLYQFNYWKKAYLFYRNVEREGVIL